MNTPVLSLKNVQTHIGRFHILHGVSFDVQPGKTTVMLGRNGAGKSTTLRTIMGLWQAKPGEILLDGESIVGMLTPDIVRKGVAFVPEEMGLFGQLTVAENLSLSTQSGTIADDRLDRIFEWFPALKTFWRSPAGNLSGGQKQMLAIARAVTEQRKLILIDEPTKGLAPVIVENLRQAMLALKQEQTTILLVEQNFDFAASLGDDVVVIEDGKAVYHGEMGELAESPQLQQRWLGLGAAKEEVA